MEPTLLIGDHLLVNRLSYVVKVPFTDIVLFHLGSPERGDVVVFRYPLEKGTRILLKGSLPPKERLLR